MPIDLTQWPLASDVEALITGAGFWPADTAARTAAAAEIDIALVAAVAEFGTITGWQPFLAAGADTTRHFALPDTIGLLRLDAGLVTLTELALDGVDCAVDHDFWLRRSHAAVPYPYDQVQFAAWVGTTHGLLPPEPVAITGRWGYAVTLPEDAWNAVRTGGAALTVLNLTTASDGIIRTVAESGFRQIFDLGVKRPDRIHDWFTTFTTTAARYTRVVV